MTWDPIAAELVALASVIMIDLVLAADNAIVIGVAAAALPRREQRRAIAFGIAMAALCRIAFAVVAAELLTVIGLALAGGLLLLWVCWKLWRELRSPALAVQTVPETSFGSVGDEPTVPWPKSFGAAALQITVADITMSLDNVLAVAGAAREHTTVLVLGLAVSVALMGVAAGGVARLIARYRWLGYVGLAVVFYVAVSLIYAGADQIVSLLPRHG